MTSTIRRKPKMIFVKPGRDYDGYICPAGPGMPPIPKEGAWYEESIYLRRRVLCGDAIECSPGEASENQPESDLRGSKKAAKAKE